MKTETEETILPPVTRQRQPLGEPASDQRIAQARAVRDRLLNEEREAARIQKRPENPVPTIEEILGEAQGDNGESDEPTAPTAPEPTAPTAPEPTAPTAPANGDGNQ